MGILQIPPDCRGHDTICRGALAPSTSIRLTFISAAAALSMLAGTTAPSARRPSSHMRLSHVVVDFFFFFFMLPKIQTNKETSGGADKLAVSGRSDEPSGAADRTCALACVTANANKDTRERSESSEGARRRNQRLRHGRTTSCLEPSAFWEHFLMMSLACG